MSEVLLSPFDRQKKAWGPGSTMSHVPQPGSGSQDEIIDSNYCYPSVESAPDTGLSTFT